MKQRGSTRQELEIWGFAPNIFKRFTNETNNYIKLLKDLYLSLKISTDSYGEGKSKGGIVTLDQLRTAAAHLLGFVMKTK